MMRFPWVRCGYRWTGAKWEWYKLVIPPEDVAEKEGEE